MLNDGALITILVSGVLAGVAGVWRELRRGDSAQSRVATLESGMSDLRLEVDRLKQRLDAAYLQIAELKGDKAALMAQNAALRQAVEELREQNKSLREELTCVRRGQL